jgi:hypothetical protein
VTTPHSFNGQPCDSWDPDAAIELGNAWITFGNTFNTQLGNMSTALYSLTEGPWTSDGPVAAEDAKEKLEAELPAIFSVLFTLIFAATAPRSLSVARRPTGNQPARRP